MVYTRLSKTRPSVRAVVQKRNEEVSVKSGEKVDSSTKAQPESERPMPEYSSSGWDQLKARFQNPGETIAVQTSGDSPQIQLARKKSSWQRVKNKSKANQQGDKKSEGQGNSQAQQNSPVQRNAGEQKWNKLNSILAPALKRKLDPAELQAAAQGKLLNELELGQVVRHLKTWNNIKSRFIDDCPELMKQIINYREKVVKQIITQILDINPEFQTLDVVLGDNSGVVRIKLIDAVAAGSTDLSSDYDITFSAKKGKESLEILAVDKFNDLFRKQWGKESGLVFDTNVYTSGHMRPEAFHGHGSKLNLVNRISAILKNLEDKRLPLTEDKILEINQLVFQIQSIPDQQTSTKLFSLDIGTLNVKLPIFVKKLKDLQKDLKTVVKEQYQESKDAYGVGEEFDEIATVMSLLHMKEYWQQGQSAGANWNYYKKRMTSQKLPAHLKQVNKARIKEANKIHNQLLEERRRKIASYNSKAKNQQDANLEMKANNELYVEYLQRVQNKKAEIKAIEGQSESSDRLKTLKLELQTLQSKALFFANEAYLTAPAAEQVVLNQQIGLGVKIPVEQYLTSINEQVAFIGEQIHHSHGNFGRALWKTAKYVERLLKAIEAIDGDTHGSVPSQKVKNQVDKLNPLIDNLLKKIKKNESLKDSERDKAAKNLAQANSSLLGRNPTEFSQKILDLQVNVTLQAQSYLTKNKS
ncbi:MAG TPA: hypothetical protein VK203_31510 [Nostocaceae cyanobacterium]|nr:hypothetical protein [Nostocaceae cyanobacterium]